MAPARLAVIAFCCPLMFSSCCQFIPFGEIDLAASVSAVKIYLMDGRAMNHGTLPSLCSVTVATTHFDFENFPVARSPFLLLRGR